MESVSKTISDELHKKADEIANELNRLLESEIRRLINLHGDLDYIAQAVPVVDFKYVYKLHFTNGVVETVTLAVPLIPEQITVKVSQ